MDIFCNSLASSSIRNEEEEDRTEKVEKGTKVRRTFSSLRNRVTGSFNKDKVNNNTSGARAQQEIRSGEMCTKLQKLAVISFPYWYCLILRKQNTRM